MILIACNFCRTEIVTNEGRAEKNGIDACDLCKALIDKWNEEKNEE